MGRFDGSGILLNAAHDNAGRVQVIVERFGFAQEFRAEEDIVRSVFRSDLLRIANRNRGFDDHDRPVGRSFVPVYGNHLLDDGFDSGCIEIVFGRVVVGRGRYNDEIRIGVRFRAVRDGSEIQLLLLQVLLNIIILDRGNAPVNHVNLLRNDIDRCHMVVL